MSSSGYIPFPSFKHWATAANGFQAFERLAAEFDRFSAEQRARFRNESTRSAAVDSNAIEGIFTSDRGFTYSIATMAHGWETAMEEKGPHVRPAFDAAMMGYNLALDVATEATPLSEAFIRHLHTVIMSSQDDYVVRTHFGMQRRPLPKGTYKTEPNFPTKTDGTTHFYASPEETALEMRRLMTECTCLEFRRAHPVVQASYIHYCFVSIHPFADGNGRVARALASIFLYRRPGIPLVIFDDEKLRYYQALEHADSGNYRPFIDFIDQRALNTMNAAMDAFESADTSTDDLLRGISTPPNNPHASRLADAIFTAIEREIQPVISSDKVQVLFTRTPVTFFNQSRNYELAITGQEAISLVLLTPGGQPKVNLTVGVFAQIPPVDKAYPNLQVVAEHLTLGNPHPIRPLGVFEHEIVPQFSTQLSRRVDVWAQKLVHWALREYQEL